MPDGGKGYELVRGKVKERNVSTESSRVGGELYFHIRLFLATHPLGWAFPQETGFRCFAADPTDPDRVRKPDAAFVSFVALPVSAYKRKGFCEAIPDLVVEVISPGNSAEEVEEKRVEWLRVGVREVWVVNPSTQNVHVYRAGGYAFLQEADTLTTPLLPGFSVPVADLFRLPAPPQAPAAGGE
jgi:Uma2 family endonuclease